MSNILNDIDELIEESALRSLLLYGIGGSLNNWIEKKFSSEISANFKGLLNSIEKTIEDLEVSGIDVRQYVNIIDLKQTLNKSISQCKGKKGACIYGKFFENINTIIKSILKVYISELLVNREKNVGRSRTFQAIVQFSPKTQNLKKVAVTINQLYKDYMKALNSREFNQLLVLGKMNRARVTSDIKVKLIKELDTFVRTRVMKRMTGMKMPGMGAMK
jgi:hypothetical protein